MEQLAKTPYAFDFFVALRMLECAAPQLPRLGYSRSPAQDVVRLAQSPALDFAPSTIEKLEAKDAERAAVLFVRHFGLFGPNGPLPLCLTEYAADRLHGRYGRAEGRSPSDPTMVAFCNVFHHRLLSFFYRAWADSRKACDYDRLDRQNWSAYIGSLIGLGMDSLRDGDDIPDKAKLHYAGRLVQPTRNAEGLRAILQDFFGLQTEIQPFVGRWLDLPRDNQCKLGDPGGKRALGSSVIVGSRFWTCQLHFRIRMGPMRFHDYERMLPRGSSFKRLMSWVRNYCGEHHFWDLQLVLHRDEVPDTRLGVRGRLGWTTWLKTKPFDHHAEDLTLRPQY
jgi:type VI secretion system protein ImpH